jgi:hypothetical protein
MSILDLTYFQKANALNIPLSVSAPIANASMQTPNMEETLTLLIDSVEKSILLNSLGLNLYNLLITALEDIDNPTNARFKSLVEGEEYDGKIWEGLLSDENLLACRVYQLFQEQQNTILSGVGNVQVSPEKANLVTPAYKIASANQNFIYKYQNGLLTSPIVIGNFTDWFGCNDDIQVSLYRYLVDKAEVFPEWDLSKFKYYETINSFGI